MEYRTIKNRIKEIRQDIKDVKKWNGRGYSESYVSGYKKAYEQLDRIINNLKF
jgi:hypothetical protein